MKSLYFFLNELVKKTRDASKIMINSIHCNRMITWGGFARVLLKCRTIKNAFSRKKPITFELFLYEKSCPGITREGGLTWVNSYKYPHKFGVMILIKDYYISRFRWSWLWPFSTSGFCTIVNRNSLTFAGNSKPVISIITIIW